MSNDVEKKNGDLERLGRLDRLIDRYAQSRSFGLWAGVLCLIVVVAICFGMPTPFAGKDWIYSYGAALSIYGASAGLVTMIVVHLYNRKVLRKIKEMRPFGEQQVDSIDTQQH